MKVATHPGNFHADDVFAVAALRLATDEPMELVRTRDEEAQAAADVRIDVGGRADPATGDFDHHQKGGAGERPNGIRYASFGLVWREHGEALAGSADAAAAIDERLVQGVDANDTGQTIIEPLVEGVRPLSISGVIAAMNPVWDEELTAVEEDARFEEAVALATRILERELAAAGAFARARQLVADAIARAGDPRIVELDRNMPWREVVVTSAPEARFVIYPKSDGWGLQAVPRELGSFDNRLDLPEAWAGRSGDELVAATGVEGAVFCHAARFYASARTRDGILALAQAALADGAAEVSKPG
jgi:uncharacterized UPF0160 family protein